MAIISTQSKRFIPNFNKGFTLIELVVGGVVSLLVVSVTLGIIIEQRRLFNQDRATTTNNLNLRTASEFIGADVKQAGERVEDSSQLPVIQLFDGGNNTPDTLIIQKKILLESLKICQDVAQGDTELFVSETSASCNPNDGDGDGLTNSLDAFKDYRCDRASATAGACTRGEDDSIDQGVASISSCNNTNECVFGYLYNPASRVGEFFFYTDEVIDTLGGQQVNKLRILPAVGNQFQRSYSVSDAPIIYIMEEKKYGLCNNVLQVTVNRRPEYGNDCPFPSNGLQPVRLTDGLTNMQIEILPQDGSAPIQALNNTSITPNQWKDMGRVVLRLTTEDDTVLESNFFPRNVLSEEG